MAIYTSRNVKNDVNISVKEIEMEVNAFLSRLEIEYEKLVAGGMSAKIAKETILGWVDNNDSFYRAFSNKMKKVVSSMNKNLVAKPIKMYAEKNLNKKFKWILGPSKSTCEICRKHSQMEPRTIDEWRSLGYGLPREGLTPCRQGCMCIIQPIEDK